MIEEKYTEEYFNQIDKEMKFVSLTFDPLFKAIMLRNIEFFKEFLIKILKLEISDDDNYILFLDKELVKGKINEKGKIVDINVKLGSDLLIDVEINRSIYAAVKKKNDAYIDKIITLQLEVGDSYKVIKSKKVYQLNLNASEKETDKVESRTIVEYDKEHKKITDESKVKVLKNLVRYKEKYYNKNESLTKDEIFLVALLSENYTQLYHLMKKILSKDKLNTFMESVIEMNKDEFILHEWEKEKLDKLVKDTEMELAREEGIILGKEEGISLGREETITSTIRSMLENNIDYETISKVTGKTIKEIKEIENSMKE